MSDIYNIIYALAEPYWQTRSGEIHIPESYSLAKQLLTRYPTADPAVVLPAILLHDIGYFGLPEDTQMQGLSGSPRGWNADVTRIHEIAGARRAAEILARLNYDPLKTAAIVQIVDGHDSRREALALEDALVKDADKLWRFTASGVRISRRWVGQEPDAFMDYVESKIDSWMLTKHGAAMARDILAATRRRYQEEGEDAVECA
jgi:HD superfamily phosphodiesterase